MKEKLAFINRGKTFTTSLILAQGMGISARSVKSLIEKYKAELESFGRVTFQMQTLQTNGGPQEAKVYFLTEEQATFVISLMRNTPQVMRFKKELVEHFYEMRMVLNNLTQAKDNYKALSEAIYNFYGDSVNPHVYSNEANMINRTISITSAKRKQGKLCGRPSKSLRVN